MRVVPTKAQWRKWSLPSRLTVVGAYLAAIPIAGTLLSGVGNALHDHLASIFWISTQSLSEDYFHRYTGRSLHDTALKIEVEYPRIRSLVQSAVVAHANEEIRESIADNLKPDVLILQSSFSTLVNDGQILSLLFKRYTFYRGAFNGDGSYGALNISVRDNRFIEFYDVFDIRSAPLLQVKALLQSRLERSCPLGNRMANEGYVPRFAISDSALVFLFSEYEVTAGACGAFTVAISYKDLGPLMRQDGPLGSKYIASGHWDGRENKRRLVGVYW